MPGTLCYQKVYFKTNPCRSQDILLFSFPPKLAACFPNPFFQWDKAVSCHLWRQMANWLNTLTKEFTQQTTNQWKYRYTAFFFFFPVYFSIFETSSFDKEETVGKENETQGEIKFSCLVLWEAWCGLAPFIFVPSEIFLSYEISPQYLVSLPRSGK